MALQIRRGTNAERLDFTPVEGEIIFVTDSQLVTIEGAEADTVNSIITCAVEHGLSANQKIKLISNDGFGLVEGTVYYVLEAGLTSLSFKISLTQGGSAVALTTTLTPEGTGPIFAVGPTDINGVPYGYSIAPVWAGDGLTAGGVAAGAAVLDELADVTIGVDGFYGVALNNYQHLQFDGVTNQWRNVSNVVIPGTLYAGGATTLNSTLLVRGNTTFGNDSADTVTFTGPTVTTPNGLNFDSNTLVIDAANNAVGVGGTPTVGYKFDVGGNARVIGTLTAETNLVVKNNATLGDAVGDLVTINAGSINAPNNLSFLGSSGAIGMHYDWTNRRLGIGTNTPAVELDVDGQLYVSDKAEVNGNLEVNGNTTLGDSSADTLTLNGYNVYIPNSLAIDTDLVIINSTENKIGLGGNIDTVGAYRVNVTGGIQTSGDININGADLRTDQTTFNILPANANTINVGSSSSTVVVKNALNVDGIATIVNATDSTSQDTGALQVNGGVGINKHLHVGGSLSVDNTDAAINPTTGSIQTDGGLGVVGTAWIGGDLRVDATTASTSPTTGAIQTDGGLGVSGDANIGGSLVVAGNLTVNGTTTTVNSTTVTVDDKNLELGSVASPSDATASGGGITLKGTTDKTITWESATGRWTFNQGTEAPYVQAGNVAIAPGTNDNSITTTTGNLNLLSAGGTINVYADIITSTGSIDTSFGTGLLFESASTITIGGVDTASINLGDNAADPKTTIFANGDLEVHDNLQVLGSTTLGNDVELDMTTIQGALEVIGSTGIVTLYATRDTRRLGVGTASPTEKLHVVGNGYVTGNFTVDGNIYGVDDIVVSNGINYNNVCRQDQRTATTTSTNATPLDSLDVTVFRTAKYVIEAVSGGEVHTVEVLLTHNGTTAAQTTYGEIYTGSSLFSVSCDVNSGFARLLVTPTSATSTVFKAARTAFNA